MTAYRYVTPQEAIQVIADRVQKASERAVEDAGLACLELEALGCLLAAATLHGGASKS